MVTRKQIWDFMDKLEGKKPGSSYANYEKEMEIIGIKKKKKHYCKYCGGPKDSPDEDILCKVCQRDFGHARFSEL